MDSKTACKLCKKLIMTSKRNKVDWVDRTVHVKCGDWLDEIFHERCWKKLKVPESIISSVDNWSVAKYL